MKRGWRNEPSGRGLVMKPNRKIWGMLVLIGLLLLAMTSVSSAGLFDKDETVGERFRKAIEKKAEYCKTHKINPANRRCEIVKLQPADPFATEEGRFAHSIKIPNPVSEDSGYKPGMTSQEYFDHLCKTEAGEFIYKTVENVEGLYMMRLRRAATDDELSHLYAMEDPYGYVTGGSVETERELLVRRGAYAFLEELAPSENNEATYRRYTSKYTNNEKTLVEEEMTMPESRFGYIWRGITRPHDREHGIAGGELLVINAQTNEVLAVRRGFIRSGDVRNNLTGIWWLGGYACPKGKKGRTDFYTFDFLREVLLPASSNMMRTESADAAK